MNRSPGALESRSRWRLACNLPKNSALALKFLAICDSAPLDHPVIEIGGSLPQGGGLASGS
eukprot:7186962-Pyramimonas_sp.AAC.1